MGWDLLILLVLIFISISVPYRITFIEKDSKGWVTVYTIMDVCFGIDILLTFNTSYADIKLAKEIYDRKKIALNYVKGWLIIDIISVIPFDAFLTRKGGVSSIAKFARFGRLYKIIRILRLVKLFKILKSKNTVQAQINTNMMIDTGSERLLFLGFFLVIFFHICACAYVMLADFISPVGNQDDRNQENIHSETWLTRGGYLHATDKVKYLTSLYFIITTVATVGYGDVSANNQYEKMFVIVLMLIGVTIFSFISGALASIISNYDFQQAQLQEKLLYLNKLRSQYKISQHLFQEIKKVLTFDSRTNLQGLDIFIQQLPNHLKLQISRDIHRETFKKFKLFKDIGSKHFLGWLGTRLKPKLYSEKQFIYQDGDIADSFYFQTKGISAFYMPQRQAIFAVVNPQKYLESNVETRARVFQYFGFEDTVINHTQLLIDFEDEVEIRTNAGGEKNMTRRHYTLQCIENSECLVLTFEDFDRMKRDFLPISRKFIQQQMQQTKWIMAFHLHVLKQGKEKEQQLNQVNPSSALPKMSNFDDTDMYSTLTWSATDSSESFMDLNEEEESKVEKKSFKESFKDKLGLGKSEVKLQKILPQIEERSDFARKSMFSISKGLGPSSPMQLSMLQSTSKQDKFPQIEQGSRNEFKMEMMKVISLQTKNQHIIADQSRTVIDFNSSNLSQNPQPPVDQAQTEQKKQRTRRNTVHFKKFEDNLLSPFQKRQEKQQKKPYLSKSPQANEEDQGKDNIIKSSRGDNKMMKRASTQYIEHTEIRSTKKLLSETKNKFGQQVLFNDQDTTVQKSEKQPERVYTEAQKQTISQIAAKASKFSGINGLSIIFKEVQAAQRKGLLPQPEKRFGELNLIKRLKSRIRHKLDDVTQDMKVGQMLKNKKVKILESIMSEQSGKIILKIQNPDFKQMQTFFKEKMDGLEERLNTKQNHSHQENTLADQIQQAMRQQTETLATFMKSVECKLDSMHSEMHSLKQKVELLRNDE